MKLTVIVGIVVAVAVIAGAGGLIFLKPSAPSGPSGNQPPENNPPENLPPENQPPENAPIIRLYYTYPTDPEAGKDYLNQNYGSAYSSDGVNFTDESGARLSGAYLSDPDVFKESDNNWVLFYSKAVAPEGNPEKDLLLKATCTAPNGTFTIDNSFSGSYGNISSTVKIDNTFYVYGVSSGIKVSTYSPTTNQLSLVGTAVSGQVFDPSVIQISSNSFKMYYKQSGNTYSADSTDGLIWTNNTKIVDSAEVPGAVYVGGKVYLYYGNSASDNWQGKMLVRISTNNGATFGSPQVVTGLREGNCDGDPVVYE
jgi:hypothetical protein